MVIHLRNKEQTYTQKYTMLFMSVFTLLP